MAHEIDHPLLKVMELSEDIIERDDNGVLPPHRNVAFSQQAGRPRVFNILKKYERQREDAMRRKSYVLQLAHAFHHLCTKRCFISTDLDQLEVRVANDDPTAVLVLKRWRNPERNSLITYHPIFLDVISRYFGSAINNSNDEYSIFHRNLSNVSSTEEILKLPYFWDNEKKLNFLVYVTDYAKGEISGNYLRSKIDHLTVRSICTNRHDWKNKLNLLHQEIKEAESKLGAKSLETTVTRDTILNFLRGRNGDMNINDVDGRSVFSLLKFIRNVFVHFHERDDAFQACFNFKKYQGIWKLVDEKFPNLFYVIHDIVVSYTKEYKDTGIDETFFVLAKNSVNG